MMGSRQSYGESCTLNPVPVTSGYQRNVISRVTGNISKTVRCYVSITKHQIIVTIAISTKMHV